jgi:hypothetical protein
MPPPQQDTGATGKGIKSRRILGGLISAFGCRLFRHTDSADCLKRENIYDCRPLNITQAHAAKSKTVKTAVHQSTFVAAIVDSGTEFAL